MKKLLITLAIGVMCHSSIAQNKITRYCEIESDRIGRQEHLRLSKNKVDSLFSFRDSTIKNNLDKVSTFKTVPDALNYMSSLGWRLITATMANWQTTEIRFYFKKEFDPSEISK